MKQKAKGRYFFMDERGKRIKEYVEAHEQEIIGDLVELTKAQSPTTCKELADACGQKIRELVKERVGIDGTIYPQEKRGDHMSFTLGEQKEQILMLAHFDTVWDKDALPLRQEGDVLYGPGAYDMKAGLVSAIWAMKICKELELPLQKRLCLLCNSDEEVGSGTSQALIEEKARESAAALCLEPSQGQTGNLKTARKGTGKYVVTVHGRAAHAGNEPEKGVSALEEAARISLFLHSLTDLEKGTTVNVGVSHGGTRANIVAAQAEMEIDVRTWTMEEAQRIDGIIKGLKPSREGITLKVEGDIGRPALEFTPRNQQLFALAQKTAEEMGLSVEGAFVGGGSDGNFTSALGIPTLDGLGAVGQGAHAQYEQVQLSAWLERVALLTQLVTRI